MCFGFDWFRLLLISISGWMSQQQRDIIDYLQEENRVLCQQLGGKRLRLAHDQRRRLAVKAKKVARRVLREVATIVTPETVFGVAREIDSAKIRWAGDTAVRDAPALVRGLRIWWCGWRRKTGTGLSQDPRSVPTLVM